jgi:hypothetical protein
MTERCPIEDPHFCLGARCQLTGICDFNRRLAKEQQPLGSEFQKVLTENAWDLYARDDQ